MTEAYCSRCATPSYRLLEGLCGDCNDFMDSPYWVRPGKTHAFLYAPSLDSASHEFCRICGKPRASELHDGTASATDIYDTHYGEITP